MEITIKTKPAAAVSRAKTPKISSRSNMLVPITFAALGLIGNANAAVDSPTVTEAFGGNGEPITVGQFDDVDAIGYEEREYFVAGNAHKHKAIGKLTSDGKWNNVELESASKPFKTRVVVYTPKDAARFNGTVYIEWQNNSGLADNGPDWVHGHVEVARQGAAYILVSAQPIGIATLKAADPWWVPVDDVSFAISDPARYASLKHPGNNYALDLFSQVAQAVHDDKLLGGLKAQRLIGVGESQSASWLTAYINGAQRLANVFDGFLVHSSFGAGLGITGGGVSHLRDDLVPVLLFQSETDVQLGGNLTRQEETESGKFRLWEVAGTAHYDLYGLVIGLTDTGDGSGEVAALDMMRNPGKQAQGGLISCANGVNMGPMHWVYGAAMHSLNRWVTDGFAPPIAPRLESDNNPLLLTFQRDELGIARGGIRTPFVDAPLAMLSGFGNQGAEGAGFISGFCFIFGQTVPLTTQQLSTLYSSNEDFAAKFRAAAESAVAAGFLLGSDAERLIDAAENFDLGL
jgi:hypothetical protein